MDLWDEEQDWVSPIPELPEGAFLSAAIRRLVERIDAMVEIIGFEQLRAIINPAAFIQMGVDVERFRMGWAVPLGLVLPDESFGSGGKSCGPMSTEYLMDYLWRLRAALVKAHYASNAIMIGCPGGELQ